MISEEQFIARCRKILAKEYYTSEASISLVIFEHFSGRYRASFDVDDEYFIKALYVFFGDEIYFSVFEETGDFQAKAVEESKKES